MIGFVEKMAVKRSFRWWGMHDQLVKGRDLLQGSAKRKLERERERDSLQWDQLVSICSS
jgi:hypothetical protein